MQIDKLDALMYLLLSYDLLRLPHLLLFLFPQLLSILLDFIIEIVVFILFFLGIDFADEVLDAEKGFFVSTSETGIFAVFLENLGPLSHYVHEHDDVRDQ